MAATVLAEETFDAMEAAAKRADCRDKAEKAIGLAISRIVLGSAFSGPGAKQESRAATAFFATVLLRLRREPREEIGTAATDGRHLWYNPAFIVGLPLPELVGVLVHEVLHVANKHHVRQESREARRWNIAGDLAINCLLELGGIALPSVALQAGRGEYKDFAKGLSAEAYYPLIPDQAGDAAGFDPGGCGGVVTPGDGSEAAIAQADAETSVLLAQAHATAKLRGTLPAYIDRLVAAALAPVVDWRRELADFLTCPARNDYRWSPPNRRHVYRGLYLPSVSGEELGDVVIAFDTSGSIGQETMDRFAAEIQGILDCCACRVTILYHDCEVAGVQEWNSEEGPLVLDPKGGGGTSHVCVFEWLEKHPEIDPVCLVCLTDLYTQFPDQGPGFPVLWCVHRGPAEPKAPFGRCVAMP